MFTAAVTIRAACGIALDDSVEVAGDRLRSSLRPLLSVLGLREEELDQTVFALATTAGISLTGNPLERMEPRTVAEELGRAWPRFAGAYASRGPLVIVVEDLHWAEDRLLEMLERILARSSGPLVMVATARPEFERMMTTVDPHPLPRFRAAGALMNMPTFARAFDCQPGDKMVKSFDQICKIW